MEDRVLRNVLLSKAEDNLIKEIIKKKNEHLLEIDVFNFLAELPRVPHYTFSDFINEAVKEGLDKRK